MRLIFADYFGPNGVAALRVVKFSFRVKHFSEHAALAQSSNQGATAAQLLRLRSTAAQAVVPWYIAIDRFGQNVSECRA